MGVAIEKKVREIVASEMSPEEVTAIQAALGLVVVDKSTLAAYPGWVKEILHPELAGTGPESYRLSELDLYVHPDQASNMNGMALYGHVKDTGKINDSLELSDLHAIQALGIDAYRRNFAGKVLIAWKSVVRNGDGNLCVPCLFEDDDKVVLGWSWLDGDFNDSCLSPSVRK